MSSNPYELRSNNTVVASSMVSMLINMSMRLRLFNTKPSRPITNRMRGNDIRLIALLMDLSIYLE